MSALRSNSWRLVLLPVLLSVALLLPTLHVHPAYEHDEEGHSNQHTIIHADFLSLSAGGQQQSHSEDTALNDIDPVDFSQSSLSALPAGGAGWLTVNLEKSASFLTSVRSATNFPLVFFARGSRYEHPPPLQQIFLAPIAPRSPPALT